MTESTLIAAGILVAAGRWAEGKGIDHKTVLGMVVVIIMLNLMAEANADLAGKFAFAILVGATIGNVPLIARKLGYSTGENTSEKQDTYLTRFGRPV